MSVSNVMSLLVVVALAGLIDRAELAPVLVWTQVLLAGACLLLLPCYVRGFEDRWVLVLGVMVYILIEGGHAVYYAALETALADLAPASWSSSRTAVLLLLQRQVQKVLAPMIGWGFLASGWMWPVPLLSTAAVVVPLMLFLGCWSSIPARSNVSRDDGEPRGALVSPRTVVSDALQASAWIRRQPVLVFLLLVAVANGLVLFPFQSLLPAFLDEMKVQNPATAYARSSAAYGVGTLLATVCFTQFRQRNRRAPEIAGAAALTIAAILGAVSVLHGIVVLTVGMFFLGALLILLIAVAGGTWLDLTPSSSRVRVFGLRRLVSFGSEPIGAAVLGLVGAQVGFLLVLRVLLVLVGVIVVVGWTALLAPRLVAHGRGRRSDERGA